MAKSKVAHVRSKNKKVPVQLVQVLSKNPLFRGGGRVFGPRVRDYSQKVNKKVKRLARKSALTIKAQENAIIVLEDFQFDSPKTTNYLNVLKSLGLENKKSVVVLAEPNNNVYLSSRNIKHSQAITSSELNTYKIVNTNSLVLFESRSCRNRNPFEQSIAL